MTPKDISDRLDADIYLHRNRTGTAPEYVEVTELEYAALRCHSEQYLWAEPDVRDDMPKTFYGIPIRIAS